MPIRYKTTSTSYSLSDLVTVLPEIGEKRAKKLSSIGIITIKDLLHYPPRRYEDRRRLTSIKMLNQKSECTLLLSVVKSRIVYTSKGITQSRIILTDETEKIEAIFWGRGYLANSVFQEGKKFFLFGKPEKYNGRWTITNPEYEEFIPEEENIHTNRIVPIYTLPDGISLRSFRRWVFETLQKVKIVDPLPSEFLQERNLVPLSEAITNLHFPNTLEYLEQSRRRLAYDEVVQIQKRWSKWKNTEFDKNACVHKTDGKLLSTFRSNLKFKLTRAQEKVIGEVLNDMSSPKRMFRLIQGDVGCGKTLVALHAILSAVDSGYQVAVMAPTEVLAEQHYLNFLNALSAFSLKIVLLTSSVKNAPEIRKKISKGEVDIIIGTHALFQESTIFNKLGLVVIDEQHRFGVLQRQKLCMKGHCPDVLYLSATPIPRTLALTVYGGMDISVIDELPPGRQPVKTYIIRKEKRDSLYKFIIEQAKQGKATYWICPSIEESESREDLKPLLNIYSELSNSIFLSLKTDVLHGRLSFSEKADVIRRFAEGKIDVLFCTTVIEVGIDVPHATSLVVENAECFGLSQLHQLRGRVGRSSLQSYCFLLPNKLAQLSAKRLKILCSINDGFKISEQDLLLRGQGEILGLRQSGESDLKFIDFSKDLHIIQQARDDVFSDKI
ncbi:MAG: ATP-dependent DNA helicase RecG [Candidatus Hydrogenedentes bacterium]|nr:ATP-dependent DNA helicase RecG [Candidatus Hydrogenedentota bacterium]